MNLELTQVTEVTRLTRENQEAYSLSPQVQQPHTLSSA